MFAETTGGVFAWISAAVGVSGTIVGILQYFNYRTKRDRIADIGTAFESVVESLASDNDVKRLAAAIRLRRFFDPQSEVGAVGAAYSRDALAVIAGILRSQGSGNFQKLLADGLAHAPSLADADLQRTNLQGSYLGGTDVQRADFYRADLSEASLKRAHAKGAVFYQSRLIGTVFQNADLRDANFYGADLSRAKFAGAKLGGASFSACRNTPREVAEHLDDNGQYVGPEVVPSVSAVAPSKIRVFVSRPSTLNSTQLGLWRLVESSLSEAGVDVITVRRTNYPSAGVLGEVRRVMADCDGIVVLGFRQLEVSSGRWRVGTPEERTAEGDSWATPWNQIEAGIATGLGIPTIMVREPGVAGGVFDLIADAVTLVVDLDSVIAGDAATGVMRQWVTTIST